MTLEQQLGIKFSAFIAGLLGGLISLTYEHKVSPIRAILMIVAGGTTAGYAFAGLETYFNLSPSYAGIFGFGVGLVAMRLIETLINIAEKVKNDPSVLLSYKKLISDLNGTSTSDNAGNVISNKSSVHASGTSSTEGDSEV